MTNVKIEQPWNDERLKVNGSFIGCVTIENASLIFSNKKLLQNLRAKVSFTSEIGYYIPVTQEEMDSM